MLTRRWQAMAGVALVAGALAVPGGPAVAGGGTVVEQLSGPTLNGAVPSGRATADQSRFAAGGATVLTVEVANVNLPDGTALDVSFDFRPVGTITLRGGRGALAADLGHLAVSNDEVRVAANGQLVLIGAFFR
jgi:hypothetical protein